MQYLLLIYENEANRGDRPKEQLEAEFKQYMEFNQWLGDRMLAGDALESTSTATTVRVQGDQTVTTDGPFAETKEALGGYYLVEAKDLDEALDMASRIPAAKHGSIEVRPVMDLGI